MVKDLVRLRSRRHRDATGQFVIEGRRAVEMAIAHGVDIRHQIVAPELGGTAVDGDHDLIEMAAAPFEKASIRQNPDGVLAVASHLDTRLANLRLGPSPVVVVVESVEKPGNLGAVLRTADASGVDAVVIANAATDIHNPNVVRASQGALFTVDLAVASTPEVLAWLTHRQIDLVATTPEAEMSYWEAKWGPAVAIAIGTEATGLSQDMLDAATIKVSIPMSGSVDSLNASVSAALLMYEVRRRQKT